MCSFFKVLSCVPPVDLAVTNCLCWNPIWWTLMSPISVQHCAIWLFDWFCSLFLSLQLCLAFSLSLPVWTVIMTTWCHWQIVIIVAMLLLDSLCLFSQQRRPRKGQFGQNCENTQNFLGRKFWEELFKQTEFPCLCFMHSIMIVILIINCHFHHQHHRWPLRKA